MPQVSYPGVYIQEIPSAVHTITNVGTSITAFVDFFREGEMDKAVEIFGMSDFGRIFGGVDTRSEASYAIAQFFLNGGSQALVIRSHASNAADPLSKATAGVRGTVATGDPSLVIFSAISEGAWGNTLRVEVDHGTADPTKLFNLTVTRYASADKKAAVVAQEKHLNVSLDANNTRDVVKVLKADSKLISATVPNATTDVPATNGTRSGVLALNQPALDAFGTGRRLGVQAGAAGPVFEATMTAWTAKSVTTLAQLATRLQLAIRTAAAANEVTPPFLTGATVAVIGAATGNPRLVVTAGRGDPDREVTDTLVFSNATGPADNAATQLLLTGAKSAANVQQYPLGSALLDAAAYDRDPDNSGGVGRDGLVPGADALVGPAADANDKGIYALRKADLFNLLCIPRAVASDMPEPEMNQIVEKSIAFCVEKRAFMLVDIPEDINEVAAIKNWLDAHDDYRSPNSAVFFPRLMIADPANEYRVRSFGASGTMAGVFARTDSDRGVWKAPAGIEATLRGVDHLDYLVTDAENGVLNPLAINCVRTFKGYGTISWGARTLFGADQRANEWKYTPVRRLALMLEESLFRGTKWVVFEPNDEPLWAKIRLNLNAYMMSLFRQGAFEGKTPKDAFYVKCDGETTTADDRNKGIVNIEVGFAPLKPAEFVVIKIQQIAGDL